MTRFGASAAASGIGLSRFTGVVRTALITNILGIGLVGDAFAAAKAQFWELLNIKSVRGEKAHHVYCSGVEHLQAILMM